MNYNQKAPGAGVDGEQTVYAERLVIRSVAPLSEEALPECAFAYH